MVIPCVVAGRAGARLYKYPELARTIGARIRAARHARGLTVRGLAAQLELGGCSVYHWEQGKRCPHIAHLQPLALQLDVTITWLVTGEGEHG